MKDKITAIILAAGCGSRMGMDQTKQLILLDGMTVLERTVLAFEKCDVIDTIVVVSREEELETVKKMLKDRYKKLYAVVKGGACRAESARYGFLACPTDTEFVAVHDAARCLVTPNMIEKIAEVAYKTGAATAAAPITDTVKRTDGAGRIIETVSREGLWRAGTPQIFSREIYERALKVSLGKDNITDDNMMVELAGNTVTCVDVGAENIKITTREDICYAEYILSRRRAVSEG